MNTRTPFKNNLKALLKAKGWSQPELARRMGGSPQLQIKHIYNIKNWISNRNQPGPKYTHLLCRVLMCSTADLLYFPEIDS